MGPRQANAALVARSKAMLSFRFSRRARGVAPAAHAGTVHHLQASLWDWYEGAEGTTHTGRGTGPMRHCLGSKRVHTDLTSRASTL